MRPFEQKGQKGLVVILISLLLIMVFGVMTSIAQEKIKRSDKKYWFTTKVETMKVDDTEGHIIQISEAKGVDVGSGAISVSKLTSDLVQGNGTVQGYVTTRYPDGDFSFSKLQGKVVTTLSPQGKPVTTGEGTLSSIKGTGQWEGLQGEATWKMKVIGEGISVGDWEGEWVRK
jgi:hypothetical protein